MCLDHQGRLWHRPRILFKVITSAETEQVIVVENPTISTPKKQGIFAPMWRAYSLGFFFTFKKLYNVNLFHKNKL
jgi:hypothetical protein